MFFSEQELCTYSKIALFRYVRLDVENNSLLLAHQRVNPLNNCTHLTNISMEEHIHLLLWIPHDYVMFSVTLNLIKCSSLSWKQVLNSQTNGILKSPIKKKEKNQTEGRISTFPHLLLLPSCWNLHAFSLVSSFLVSNSFPNHPIVQFRGFLPPFLASCLLTAQFLSVQVCLNLLLENEHPQLAMRTLVHGLGLHAHFVLLWGQLVHTLLFMPQVEETPDGRSDHDEVAMKVLAVQMYIFTTPAFNVQIKATWHKQNPK